MHMMSSESLQSKLLRLPCHFSWESLQNQNVGRTVEMNIENLEEHIQSEAIEGTEVESYNLMGFYKTQQKRFDEARSHFHHALRHSKTEDDKVVSLACLAWLTWKHKPVSDSTSDAEVIEIFNQVQNILRERNPEEIPEIMADKAFAIANSGFTENGFKEALVCVDKALEKRPHNVMYKYNKAILLTQLYSKKHKRRRNGDDAEAEEIKQLWKGLITSMEKDPRYSRYSYAQMLVQYGLFLNEVNWDKVASGMKYVEKAQEVAGSNQTAVMRNVAKFYSRACGNDSVLMFNRAVAILEKILTSKSVGVYKELSLLGKILSKQYKLNPDSDTFFKAEKYLRKSWDVNKKFMMPALDLTLLYKRKYEKDEDESALVKAEKLFREIFNFENGENTMNAMICNAYANFVDKYGETLAHMFDQMSSHADGDVLGGSVAIEEALSHLHQYRQEKQEDKLLKAEKIFREVHNSLEDLKDPVKARFYKEFAAFLNKYSRDLAFCYLKKSLEYNPQQGEHFAYKDLEKLANEKLASADKEDQIKGRMTLQWMKNLRGG